MHIPDNQRIAIYWNDKPIGLVECGIAHPAVLGGEIAVTVWRGTCLGEMIAEQSPNEVYKEARRIAHARGLRHIHIGNGEGVTTLYTPAFEE